MTYDAKQMIKLTGISIRQLHTWTEKGFLETEERAHQAHQGFPRQWTPFALRKAAIMFRLVSAGLLPAQASALLEQPEVKEDIQDDRRWVTGYLAPGIAVRIQRREDWQ